MDTLSYSRIGLLLCIATMVSAAPPGPGESRTFGLQGSPIYDVSGARNSTDGTIEIFTSVTHLASGRLTGIGEVDYDDGFAHLQAAGPLRGRVVTAGLSRRLTVAFRGPITGSDDDGNSYSGNYSLNGSALLNAVTSGEFQGTAQDRYCIRKVRCGGGQAPIRFNPGSGFVNLTFTNMQVSGSAVTGTANVRVGGSVTTFSYAITGKYNASKASYTLRLTGQGVAAGSSLTAKCIDMEPEGFRLERLTGRLLGQTLRYVAP